MEPVNPCVDPCVDPCLTDCCYPGFGREIWWNNPTSSSRQYECYIPGNDLVELHIDDDDECDEDYVEEDDCDVIIEPIIDPIIDPVTDPFIDSEIDVVIEPVA